MEYRGIKLADSVKLYKSDGSFNKQIKKSLDGLVELLEKNGHEVVSEYVDNNKKILINYNCGHPPHNIKPNNYKNGQWCSKCSNNCTEKAKEKLIQLVEANGHLMLSDYIDARTKVLIDYRCGHIPHKISPNKYKNGRGCPKCAGLCPKQAEDSLIRLVEQNGHLLLSEYKNNSTKILVNYQCGHIPYWIRPNRYKQGDGCPLCNESKGEKRIRKWLVDNEFTYESQVEYNGLLGLKGGNLSYDFYIPQLNILIEYQGEYHDGSVNYQTDEEFTYQQEHDKRKREYAQQNNIKLLEIWYYDFDNIEKILQNKLIKTQLGKEE